MDDRQTTEKTAENKISWDPVEEYKDVTVAEEYDAVRFASLSGRTFDRLEKASLRRILSDLPRELHFLDLPCGTGRLAEVLLEMGFRVTGVDISPAMLHVAQRKLERFGDQFDMIVCDARELKDTGRTFDAALCARVLMHFPLPGQIEFLQGVAAGTTGPVIISQGLSSAYQRFRRDIKTLLGNHPPAVFPITGQELNQLLAESNLQETMRTRTFSPISEAMFVRATSL